MKKNVIAIFKYAKTAITFLLIIIVLCTMNSSTSLATNQTIPADKFPLHFNADGKFNILLLADTQDTDHPQESMINLLNASLDATKPDLVVFLGDQISGPAIGPSESRTKNAIKTILSPVLKRNIPFTFVFGNHDDEGGVSKETQFEWYQEFSNCYAYNVDGISGVGNHMLPIYGNSSDIKAALYFFDSHAYHKKNGGKYDWVKKDQIEWYTSVGDSLKENTNGETVPSYAFQHIIVPEIYDALDVVASKNSTAKKGKYTFKKHYYQLPENTIDGAMKEAPCPPISSDGQFDSFVANKDIKAAFFGHDHVNSFQVPYKGIDLVACPGSTYYSYGGKNTHGVRLLTLTEDGDFETSLLFAEDLPITPLLSELLISKGVGIGLLVRFAIITLLILLVVLIPLVRFMKNRRKMKLEDDEKLSTNTSFNPDSSNEISDEILISELLLEEASTNT